MSSIWHRHKQRRNLLAPHQNETPKTLKVKRRLKVFSFFCFNKNQKRNFFFFWENGKVESNLVGLLVLCGEFEEWRKGFGFSFKKKFSNLFLGYFGFVTRPPANVYLSLFSFCFTHLIRYIIIISTLFCVNTKTYFSFFFLHYVWMLSLV